MVVATVNFLSLKQFRCLTALKFKKFSILLSEAVFFDIMNYRQVGLWIFIVKIGQTLPKIHVKGIVFFFKKHVIVTKDVLHNA